MKNKIVSVVLAISLLAIGMQMGVTLFTTQASPLVKERSVAAAENVINSGAVTTTTAHAHTTAVVDDKGLSLLGNGHHHAFGPDVALTPDERQLLSTQLAATMEVAKKYPTVKDAVAAGYRRAGPFSPGLGAHFTTASAAALNTLGEMTPDALAHPLALIYDGVDPSSRIAGFMYYSMSKAEPQGFAGPNDHWHYHTSICLKRGSDGGLDAPFGADQESTADQCTKAGGFMLNQTQWMVHVWTVPGYESAQGVFGEENTGLFCPDGTYYQRPVDEWVDHPLNSCTSVN